MNDNQMIKTKKYGILSLVLYVLAAILFIATFISLTVCQQNISMQLAQSVSIKGNELAILNIYISNCVQHFLLFSARRGRAVVSVRLFNKTFCSQRLSFLDCP